MEIIHGNRLNFAIFQSAPYKKSLARNRCHPEKILDHEKFLFYAIHCFPELNRNLLSDDFETFKLLMPNVVTYVDCRE